MSRVIYGARSSLVVSFGAVLLGTTVGSLWGLASGYLGGKFDIISQRIMEILQAFPDLILAMAISIAIGTGMRAVIVAIAVTRIPFGGRVIRSVALTVKELAYVEAGRSVGASQLRIMGLHILPQCLAPYLVLATTHLGVAIIIEAALGFPAVVIPHYDNAEATTDTDLGEHVGRFVDLAGAALVAGVFPRTGHYGDRSGLQPAWGWDSRYTRPTSMGQHWVTWMRS